MVEALERISKHKVSVSKLAQKCLPEAQQQLNPKTRLLLLLHLQGVEGVLIAGNDGQIHKTTLDEQLTQQYASQVPSLAALARNVVRDLDPQVTQLLLLLQQDLSQTCCLLTKQRAPLLTAERLDVLAHQKPKA